MSAAVIPLPVKRVRACDAFYDAGRTGAKWCAACGFARALHLAHVVGCSQCGGTFKRDRLEGYSHCRDHRRAP